jgi:type IV secretory pathway VirB2 component (pilin)
MTQSRTYTLPLSIFFLTYLLFTNPTLAADINTVFADVNTKTNSIMDWALSGLVYFIAVIAFIAWCVAMLFKKMSYVEGISILIIIILIGFAPTIVSFLLNRN